MHDTREVGRETVEVGVTQVADDRRDPGVGHPLAVAGSTEPREPPHLVLGCEHPRDRERDLPGHPCDEDLLATQQRRHHNSSVYLSVPTSVGMNGEAKVTRPAPERSTAAA